MKKLINKPIKTNHRGRQNNINKKAESVEDIGPPAEYAAEMQKDPQLQ